MRFAIVVLLVACGSSSSTKREPPPPVGSASGSEIPVVVISSPEERLIENATRSRCLPVVAKKCHCTYECMLGQSRDKEKTFQIDWHGAQITGVVENYCVEGKCTDVFAVDLECDVICPLKAANPNCRTETTMGAVECKSS